LGLSIVKHIAQVHSGGVTVSSTPGEGSTFTLVSVVLRIRPGTYSCRSLLPFRPRPPFSGHQKAITP
jgi:hypothetical protein